MVNIIKFVIYYIVEICRAITTDASLNDKIDVLIEMFRDKESTIENFEW